VLNIILFRFQKIFLVVSHIIHANWGLLRHSLQVLLFGVVLAIALIQFPALAVATASMPGSSANVSHGAQVFEVNCAGCHAGGGNIVRRGKTLKLKALQRNDMDSLEAIAQIVTHGKNNMSAYRDRLTSEEIQAVAEYVWQQAQHNWRL
jgi:cytochrome c6